MIDCCDNSGGRVILTIDGDRYSARTTVTIRPTNIERDMGANQDGTPFVTTKPMPAEAEITLSDRCGLNLDKLINACHIDGTIQLVDMNKTYLFTRATVIGRPEIDTESGEIKGIKLGSMFARQINTAAA